MLKLKKYYYLLILFGLFLSTKSFSQEILFSEDFESGMLPYEWSQSFVSGAISWRYENGGYTTQPSVPNSRRPPAAHGGMYNALFQYQSINNETTKLITKKISSLEFAIKPELHFWHAQYAWKHGEEYYNDELRVYYKNNDEGEWILLKEYQYATTDWEERIILLPDSTLSADYYLAFEGKTNWGWGTCLDDIEIIETGIRTKYVSLMNVSQASELPISSGSKNNPMLKFQFKVFGNSGTCLFESLEVNSLNTRDEDLSENGVKLFFTEESEFNSNTPVGTPGNFVNGKAAFENINIDLPTGYSYLWLTYDIDSLAEHNDVADLKILPQKILINDTLYPPAEISPAGFRKIYQTIFFDDFEDTLLWELSGEFEHGEPQGLGGTQGNPDPSSTISGTKIIGTDLSGLNALPGDYEINVPDRGYTAVSPSFNFKYYNDLLIRYQRWLNIGINDYSYIEVSDDDGATWTPVWYNTSLVIDDKWTLHEVDISDLAARKENIKIRFALGSTNNYWQFSGWNIDDFAITGNYITKDIGITNIQKPLDGCHHTSADSVTVVITNFSAEPTPPVIPVRYTLIGGGKTQVVYDTIYESIPFEQSMVYSFKTKADLSVPDIYSLTVTTLLPGDEDNANDPATINIIAQPSLSIPHTEDFELSKGLWMVNGKYPGSWEWGTPSYGIIPPSGTQVWKTKIGQYYLNLDSSFVESGCYDLENDNRYMVELKYWMKTEADKDGASVQYSTDNGNTWHLVDTNEFGWNWNWYDRMVEASGLKGWSGDSSKWITAVQLLPASIPTEAEIKFRILFASDSSENDIGFAVDDFKVYPAPPDVGVSSVELPDESCLFENPEHVSVYIRNYGLNNVKTNDTIPVGYIFDEESPVYNDFILSSDLEPGDSVMYTFNEDFVIQAAGTYQVKAFTLLEDDPWLYGSNNDTAQSAIEILPLPFTGLVDTIQSREPDTVVIRAFYNPDYSYDWENGLSTADTLKVPGDGVYHVVVTDVGGNGCDITDSVYVELLYFDAGITGLVSPVSDCELQNNEHFTVSVRNFGTDSIVNGSDIILWYEVNGGTAVCDTLTLEEPLYAYHSIPYTFSDAVDLSSEGVYDLKFYLYFGGDTIRSNDTLISGLEVFGFPEVDLGPDLTVKALDYTLDAGNGFSGYLWDNGDTTQTRMIESTGTYHVRVNDEHGCPAYDTAYIHLKIRDVMPTALLSPASTCEMTTLSAVELQFRNNGNDTIPAGEKICLKYRINAGQVKSDSVAMTTPLIPGMSRSHIFADQVDLTDDGDYIFMLDASSTGDLRISNDTLYDTVSIYPKPVVDFGYAPGINIIEEYQVVLDGGEGDFYEYLWQDNSTSQTFTAMFDGSYRVKVTDSRTGCYGGDTVMLVFQYIDIGVTAVDLPESVCSGPQSDVQIQIKSHAGSLSAGTSLQIVSKVNGVITGQETKVLDHYVAFGTTFNHTLTAPVIIPSAGPAIVKVYTVFDEDKDVNTDTFTVTIPTIKPSPVVNFGDVNGVLKTSLPHMLDAGAGMTAYLWDNGLITQARTVTTAGNYWVTVTGTNGCKTTKNIKIEKFSSLNDMDNINVQVYPNPADDYFNLEIDATGEDDLIIELYNSNGMVVIQKKVTGGAVITETFEVGDYPDGIFYLRIHNGNVNYLGKIIIY